MPATVELHAGWHARRVDATPLSGEQLSAGPVDPAGWIRAIVPGTVLTTLLADRAWLEAHVPAEVLAHSANRAGFDPFWGDNARHLPDLGDRAPRDGPFRKGRGRELYTYWLRTEFHLDAALRGDERLWLELRGASYTVAVYLNGRRLEGPPEKGMFLRRVYDATGAIRRDGANALAVRVEPVDHPGTFCDINGADGEIGRNVATQYTSGWDWVPAIPDRHTGLWDRVALHSTGPVRLQDPHVITRVPGVRDPDGPQAPARLTIAATLHNASDAAQSGQLRAESDGIAVAQPVVVLPRETRTVRFAPEVFPQLVLSQPRLWWPNGMGPPSLYDLRLAFALDDGRLSDETRLRFGIRQIRSEVPAGMERVFYVNGRRVFVRGGNWVGTDALPHPVVRRDGVRLPADAYTPLFRLRRPRGLSTSTSCASSCAPGTAPWWPTTSTGSPASGARRPTATRPWKRCASAPPIWRRPSRAWPTATATPCAPACATTGRGSLSASASSCCAETG